MKLLFLKPSLVWPRTSGHDVHTFHMMRACGELGHDLGLITIEPPSAEAVKGLPLKFSAALSGDQSGVALNGVVFTTLQERFRSYWGIDKANVSRLRGLVSTYQPDAVIVAGLDALAYLPGIPPGAIRVWYAADEWVWHHLTLIHARDRSTWSHLKAAGIKGLYERAYSPLIDRAWVVSAPEKRAMRWFAGVRHVDVVPNGVDSDYFAPIATDELPQSAVFWGRLDFEPNVQALMWFCKRVWPSLRERYGHARFTIVGYRPMREVTALGQLPGIEVKPDLADLRGEVSRHALVVLPFVSGGGIKNKLLEAAALGRPIVCTRRTMSGLRNPDESGLVAVDEPVEWVRAIGDLWSSEQRRREAGTRARDWVRARHSWVACATDAVKGLTESQQNRVAS
jgi:glycosyltransferase involved in cell wall biosynthesis